MVEFKADSGRQREVSGLLRPKTCDLGGIRNGSSICDRQSREKGNKGLSYEEGQQILH
jgi:hypothetical protein